MRISFVIFYVPFCLIFISVIFFNFAFLCVQEVNVGSGGRKDLLRVFVTVSHGEVITLMLQIASALSTKLKSKVTCMRASSVVQYSLSAHLATKPHYQAKSYLLVALSISLHFGPSKFHGFVLCLV